MIEPATIEEAAVVIAAGTAAGRPVQFRGAGTKSPDAPADAVSTVRLSRVLEHRPADLFVTVEAGHPLDALNERLRDDHLRVALDPPWYGGRATVGGILAAGDAGPLRLSCGSPRDQVLGMTLILPGGAIVRSGGRVMKNVAGYALHRAAVGSGGRFGLIAAVSLRLRPCPAALRVVRMTVADAAAADVRTAALLAGSTRPAFLEWVCPALDDRAGEEDPAGIELWIGYEGDADAVDWQCNALRGDFPDARILDAAEDQRVYRRLRDWGARASLRAALPSSNLGPVFSAGRDAGVRLLAHACTATLLVHADDPAAVEPVAQSVRDAGGTILAPRAPADAAPPGHDMLRRRLIDTLTTAAAT